MCMQNNIPCEQLNELIDKSKKGDVRAFEIIVKTYQRYAFAVSFRILCCEDDAKDVVQESFVRIWKHIKSYDSKVKFTTWMYKIIVHLCYDRLKSEKRRKKMFDSMTNESSEIKSLSQINLEREFSNKETADLIKSFSEELSEKQKMVFVLRDLEDLSIQEVIEITGMSESSVKTNLFFARQNIRKKIIELEK